MCRCSSRKATCSRWIPAAANTSRGPTISAADWRPGATLATLQARAALLAAIRAFMAERGVLEVDTPAATRAAPSERALACMALAHGDWLIPSPEHGLKRLLAAGAGPVYRLGHVFRAGEAGRWHNPEFCMLEWYRPHAQMAALADETAALIETLTGARCASPCRYRDVFRAYAGIDPVDADCAALARVAARHGVAPRAAGDRDRVFWLDLLMGVVVAPHLGRDGPQRITGFCADDAVLVETDDRDPRLARRFEYYWRGVELANGAQELTDATRARRRMQRENSARVAAGKPAVALDETLLAAVAAGLPRCAGVALGVDRLLALQLGRDGIGGVMAFDWARR